MKKAFIVLISLIIIFTTAYSTQAEEIDEKAMQDFVLVFLDNTMHQAVNNYYGKPKMYDLYDAKIIEIKPLKKGERFSSQVKVQVLTYVGPHNPPYGLETITMTNDFTDIKVIKFDHSDISSRNRSIY